jgi:phage/plasmid-like protein (TIGR03299 family)
MSAETINWLNAFTRIGMVANRGAAWHSDGSGSNQFDGPVPMAEVESLLGMVQIERAPIMVTLADGTQLPYEGKSANVNVAEGPLKGKIFGVFGTESYTSHDYQEWLQRNVSNLVGDTLSVHSAGLLRNGGQAWVQVGSPELTTIAGESYLASILAATSHDGTMATTYKVAFTRIVCDNTLAAGMSESTPTYRVRHSRNSALKIESARDALGILTAQTDEFDKFAQSLLDVEVADSDFRLWVNAYRPLPEIEAGNKTNKLTFAENAQDNLFRLWNHDSRIAPVKNTLWGVFNTADTYARHEAIVRGANRDERRMDKTVNGGYDDIFAEVMAAWTKAEQAADPAPQILTTV